MKILMVSIFAPHFFNWTEQLKDSGHEVYWLDVFDSNTYVEKIDFVKQIIGWRYKWDYPGRYFLKRASPTLTDLINLFNERNLQKTLSSVIEEIKPDVVHSFVMYLSTAPILEVMRQNPDLKWIYSSWGSDLYFYRKRQKELGEMEQTFPELDYMFADCLRDHKIALQHGFSGEFLGVFPGGGGFDFNLTDEFIQPVGSRNVILVKGYQGLHGRCIPVLNALWKIREVLKDYKIIVFGAGEEVKEHVLESQLTEWELLEVYGVLDHSRVMELMGEAFLYIGNSLSDGTPNTLLEAIIMGAFPVQSNPGGATAELIQDGKNGFLIANPEAEDEIAELLQKVLSQKTIIIEGVNYNLQEIKPNLEKEEVKEKVLDKYRFVEENLKSTS